MHKKEYKRIARLLKQAYRELDDELKERGVFVDIPQEKYHLLQGRVRELLLESEGYTIEDYRMAKSRTHPEYVSKDMWNEIDNVKRSLLTKDDVLSVAQAIPPKVINKVTNKIVKERVVEKPQIIKEREVVREVDDEKIEELRQHINTLKGEGFTAEEIKSGIMEDVKGYFGEEFKKNIDVLGMPDFRKLAMGLQGQIDEIRSAGTDITLQVEIPTGTVDDSNTDFTFTTKPTLVIVNGTAYRESNGWSWASPTVTLDFPAGTGGDVYGLVT